MTRTLLAVAIVSAFGLSGLGYTWYYTGDAKAPDGPQKGVAIRWYQDELDVRLDSILSRGVPFQQSLAAIRASLVTWNTVACPHPILWEAGILEDEAAILKRNGSSYGNNLIIFQDKDTWPIGKPVNTLGVIALTTLFYNPKTGEADSYALEMNDDRFTFVTDQSPSCNDGDRFVDIENTITHELGHVLGLDHTASDVPDWRETTMYFNAGFCETKKRDLHQDDIDGLCLLYARDQAEFDHSDKSGGGGGCSGTRVPERTGAPGMPLLAAAMVLSLMLLRTSRNLLRRR